MRLSAEDIVKNSEWSDKGYKLPKFDRAAMLAQTKENPTWVHFGGGNLFRAFHAALSQEMLNNGYSKEGVIVIEGFDYEIVEKSYRPGDNLTVAITLKADGSIDKDIIGSVSESCILDSQNDAEYSRLKQIFTAPSLQMATFTITEKGYVVTGTNGKILPIVQEDIDNGPDKPNTYMGKVASLLYARFEAGELPIAMVSTDNCSHNGDKLYTAINTIATAWCAIGKADAKFVEYINDKTKVSFPWSMIDKITPRPDASVEKILANDGLEGLEPIVTSKGIFSCPG